MNRNIRFLLSAALLAAAPSAAFADGDPVVPTVAFVGCINGNLCVTLNKTVNPTNVLFQVKSLDCPGSDWRTVKFTYKSAQIPMTNVYSYYWAMDYPGETLVRVAETNAAGNSAWSEAGPVTNYIRHAASERNPGGNGYVLSLVDGVVGTIQEASNGKYQSNSNVWFGLTCNSATPVGVSMIRYLPRQDATGLGRLNKAYFQCADDKDFLTNVVTIGTVASPLSLGHVYECAINPPVTSRCFRIVRYIPNTSDYLSIDDMELVPDAFPANISMSVSNSGDWTNHWPAVTWSVPAANLCSTGVLQRALSAAGPFADVSDWIDATAGETFVDSNVVVGVTYYYRVKAQCVAASFRGFHYSDVVKYIRPRRLDRSWDDLTKLNNGVSVMAPFKWVDGRTSYYGQSPNLAFDGSTNTYCEATCYTNAPGEALGPTNRVFNPAVGVNLGAKYHICGSLVYPRESEYTSILDRARAMSICGAEDEALGGVQAISPRLGGFLTSCWQYNYTTNSADQFQYVFLWSPTQGQTYGNVSEVGFFGYSDQDIIDSGLLIPPTTVSCETNETGVVVSWDRGWNNESYLLERRRSDSDGWTPVASLETNVFSFVDTRVPRKGTWLWRVTAVSDGGDTISSLPCSSYYDPKAGLAIIFR